MSFEIGTYVKLTPDALHQVRNPSMRVPAVFKVVKVTEPADREKGLVAFESLTGPLACKAFKGPPEMIAPHLPCYACKHAKPMNDRDAVRCGKFGDEIVDSAHTCNLWDRR
ncbi:MAG: hypothetical protein RL513_1363 [Pseudomonadota bacterium]